MRLSLKVGFFIFFIPVFLILNGCAATRFGNIEKDSLDSDYSSILCWNINIRDNAGIMRKGVPDFFIEWYDNANHQYTPVFINYLHPGSSWLQWNTEAGVTTIKGPVLIKAMPGDYRIRSIRLEWNFKGVPGVNTGYGYSYDYLDVYVDKDFSVTPGQVCYIGSFNIDTTRVNKQISTNLSIQQNEDNLRKTYAFFRNKFPTLASHFQKKVLLTYLTPITPRDYSSPWLIEDFKNNTNGWKISQNQYHDMHLENGTYVVENKNQKTAVSMINVGDFAGYDDPWEPTGLPLKLNFDIELISHWLSGREDMPFGLKVTQSEEPGARSRFPLPNYIFAVSKNGESAVFKKDSNNYSVIIPWKDVKSLNGASIVKQKVEVTPDGSAYFVNGEYVGRVQTNLFIGRNTKIGVVVAGKQKVAFKRIKITGD